jgi:VanZ family protein
MLALVAMRRLDNRPMARASAAILIAVFIGMVDEWNQSFVPGRDSSWKDIVFDLLGASFSAMIIGILLRKNAAREGETMTSTDGAAS